MSPKQNMTLHQVHFSESPEQTLALARSLSPQLHSGGLLLLQGDLGAGKSCFAKGLIHVLSQTPLEDITSPTFTLVEIYEGPPLLHHVDLYRLSYAEAKSNLDWEAMLAPGVLTLVEWPEIYPELAAAARYRICFEKSSPQQRRITIFRS